MKQTTNHKLNLVEMSDTFSTQPLNENMEIIDAALKSASDTASAISQRVTSLEAKNIKIGTYRGQSSSGSFYNINVGFAPQAVFIGGSGNALIVDPILSSGETLATLTSTGFRVMTGIGLCVQGGRYNYVAID